MNLANDPLVIRSRFRSSLPDDPDMRFQIKYKLITVFVTDPEKVKLIPAMFEESVVRVICITEH